MVLSEPMITVAVGQLRPRVAQPQQALAAVEQAAQEAREKGADLLIVPEAFLSGYAIGRAAAERLAEPMDGEMASAVARIARRSSIAVVCGFPERGPDGRVFNAASFISETGEHLAAHRKLHLFQSVDAEQFSAGDDRPPVVSWNGWNVGLAICYDIEFPETVRMLAEDGADLICTPTANMVGFEQVARLIVPARAYESQLYIAYANYCGEDAAFSYAGTSVIASPTGELCAAAGPDGEELITADLHRTTLDDARRNLTYLADRRLDLYGSNQ